MARFPWEETSGAYSATEPKYCKICLDVFYETIEEHFKKEHEEKSND